MKPILPIVAASLFATAFVGAAMAADVQDKQQEVVEKQQEVKEAKQDLMQAKQAEATEQAKASNESMQQMSRASKIIGAAVTNAKGDNLGSVKDLVVNPEGGEVAYAVVSFGGLLGMGDKLFAVPWKTLQWNRDKQHYLLEVDKATLEKAKGFDEKSWPDSTSKWDQQRDEFQQYYRAKP